MPSPLRSLALAFAACLSLLALPAARGSTIAWGSGFDVALFDSNGQRLDASFSFEIGSFGSFTPTLANLADWEANWKVFDRAYGSDATGWNWENEQYFTGTAVHESNGTSRSSQTTPGAVFNQNEKVYLWVYNLKALAPTSEWALVSSDLALGSTTYAPWAFPDPADAESITHEIHLEDANTAVIGGVNGTRGGGDFTSTPASFQIQTAALPVPEPGSAALLLGALALQSLRRRRSKA
jgi:hypothetical protein